MTLLTTTTNYPFLNRSFREARRGLFAEKNVQKETKNPYFVNPDRLRGVGLEGGSRSGKTWDTCIFICEYVNLFRGKIILIARDRLARLKKTTYETLKKVWGLFFGNTKPFNKSATPIIFNGNTIFFTGVNEDSMLAHGFESDLAWINESMNCKKETIDQIMQRCNDFYILDYNPSAVKSWCFNLEKSRGHKIHRSTALTNPYCPSSARLKILSYEPTHPQDRHLEESERRPHPINVKEGTSDYYNWQVYGLGMRGKSEDLIIPEYKTFTDATAPKESECSYTAYGGDFGTDAPNVLVKSQREGNNLYWDEQFRLFLELGKSDKTANQQLVSEIKKLGIQGKLQIWDSAEKKSIRDLQLAGVLAKGARKGADSVHHGLKRIRSSILHIHKNSLALMDEIDGYVWARMANGEFMTNTRGHKIPLKKNDHGIDAGRYVDSFHYYKQ
jgi:PBSX family phage terminase large subunit